MKIKIDDFAVVKLTDYGRKVLADWVPSYYETSVYSVEQLFPTRANGRTQFALWELMLIFGKELRPDQPKCFDDTFELERCQRDIFYDVRDSTK
jgi:hypothetical protein